HRTVRAHPGVRRLTFQVFGHENEVIMLDSDIKNSGEISVIQFLRRPCIFFESDTFLFINTGKRDELHRYRSTAVVTDRFVSNDGAAARDLARRSIVVKTDRIVFGKHSLPPHPGLPRNYSSSRHAIPGVNSQPATPPNQPPRSLRLTGRDGLTRAEAGPVFFGHVDRSRDTANYYRQKKS